MDDVFETKDKQVAPFLLTQPDIKFNGTRLEGSLVYFKFSPKDRCEELINSFMCKKAPLVQPKDLLDAVESYRDIVFSNKKD